MPNFVTFDDGLTYVSISHIDSFGSQQEEGTHKGWTWVKFKDGHIVHTQWDVAKVAELLGPVANLHH